MTSRLLGSQVAESAVAILKHIPWEFDNSAGAADVKFGLAVVGAHAGRRPDCRSIPASSSRIAIACAHELMRHPRNSFSRTSDLAPRQYNLTELSNAIAEAAAYSDFRLSNTAMLGASR
jgi:hypothetical protein